ncbi:MAG TPA: hypothetical protein VEA80_05580 [Vitreimonas sp.]|nr:hypothetical protein [Vitreimonas sp.]
MVMRENGEDAIACLVSDDDEAFTYKRVNLLATADPSEDRQHPGSSTASRA